MSAPNASQNVDVWVTLDANGDVDDVFADELTSKDGVWIIYIHGGAWRDPLVSSSSFDAAVEKVITQHSEILSTLRDTLNTQRYSQHSEILSTLRDTLSTQRY
ncbi:hypothetical protein BX600DRAFT_516839 [Xylariales sp. PMI_506]|nr:hypothetical protein BX600DRAFT_516839 [Xylariales sp. PMI_506]